MSKYILKKGTLGNSLKFNGATSTYVDLGNSSLLNMTGNFSISVWFTYKQAPASNGTVFISKDTNTPGLIGWFVSINGNSNQPIFYIDGNTRATGSTVMSFDSIYHVTFVQEIGVNARIYTNAKLDGQGATVTQTATSTNMIMGNYVGGDGKCNSYIHDISLFNKALTQTEISYLYRNEGSIPSTAVSNTVGNWTMDQRSGTTVLDFSGNGINGTMNSFPNTSIGASNSWCDAYTLLPIQR